MWDKVKKYILKKKHKIILLIFIGQWERFCEFSQTFYLCIISTNLNEDT